MWFQGLWSLSHVVRYRLTGGSALPCYRLRHLALILVQSRPFALAFRQSRVSCQSRLSAVIQLSGNLWPASTPPPSHPQMHESNHVLRNNRLTETSPSSGSTPHHHQRSWGKHSRSSGPHPTVLHLLYCTCQIKCVISQTLLSPLINNKS